MLFYEYELDVPEIIIDGNNSYKVHHYRNEDGVDWTEFMKTVRPETLKIMVDSNNYISQASFDVSMLSPSNFYFYEMQLNEIPTDFFEKGVWSWNFIDGRIVEHVVENYENQLYKLSLDIQYYTLVKNTKMLSELKERYISIYEKMKNM
jgi:hypothetical protein